MGDKPDHKGFCLWDLVRPCNGGDIYPGSLGTEKAEQVRKGLLRAEKCEHTNSEM